MTRTALSFVLSALALGSTAHAADPYMSDPADIKFDGVENVINTTYNIPIGFDVDIIIANFWIGVNVELAGNQQFGLQVEGTSDVTWGGDDQQPGVLYQTITPLDGSGAAAMKSDVAFNITFDVRDGGQSGSSVISFPLFAQGINFKVDAEPFTPFMLPGQTPDSQTLNTRSQDLAFVRDFGIPIGIGVVQITPGVRLSGWPEAYAYFTGESLDTTWVDGDMVISQGVDIPGEIELYEPLPSIELSSAYNAFVQSSISYVIKADFTVELDVLGLFHLPFSINLVDYTIPLFSGSEEVAFDSATYTHPLPMFVPATEQVKFGAVDVGTTDTITFLVNNDGLLDLVGVVGIQGDAAFTAAPNQVGAAAGGQDSVVITFLPDVAGDFSADLEVQTNDPYEPTRIIHITGHGKDVPPPPVDNDGDDGDWTQVQGHDTFTSCGCASATPGSSLLPLVTLLPLVGLRRRRKSG